jgi:hypothetical protein
VTSSRFAVGLLVMAACKPSPAAPADASPPPSSTTAPTPTPTPTKSETLPPPPSSSVKTPASAAPLTDGGVSACKLLYGPAQQPWRGPAALRAEHDSVDVVFNDDGAPRVLHVAGGPIDPKAKAKAKAMPATGDVSPSTSLPCAFGGGFVFCPSKAGDVLRTPRAGGDKKSVGAQRVGYRIDATTLAGSHAMVTYLASRKTTEGWVAEAWAVVDDLPPMRVSEDGAGATSIDIAPRGDSVVILMLDARRASTQLHARVARWTGKLELGADAVLFIGGPGERESAATIATPGSSGTAWGLVPIEQSVSTFGMAAAKIADPPEIDAPVVWSTYPNGLDPAPIIATQGKSPMRVARVRPAAAEATSERVLEVGRVGDDGAFTSDGIVSTHGAAKDLAVDVDELGTVWIAYTDTAGTWLERRQCP